MHQRSSGWLDATSSGNAIGFGSYIFVFSYVPLLAKPSSPLSFMTSPAMLSYVTRLDAPFLSTPLVDVDVVVETILPIA